MIPASPHDLLSEMRIPITDLARREGVSTPTVWRWAIRGCRGVRLETYTVGARRYTTEEAFARFAAGCTAVSQGQSLSAEDLRTAAKIARDNAEADRILDEMYPDRRGNTKKQP